MTDANANANAKYAKLSDSIMIKKIHSFVAQCNSLNQTRASWVDVMNIPSDVPADHAIARAQTVLSEPTPSRGDLDRTCMQLENIIAQLKAEVKLINAREIELAQAAVNVAQTALSDAEYARLAALMAADKSDPKRHQTINGAGLDELKREFFNQKLTPASELHTVPFGFYKGVYKYSADMDGRPDFIARNLNTSFVRTYEDIGAYVIACFKLIPGANTTYMYESYWLVNSIELVESMHANSAWEEMHFDPISKDEFLIQSARNPDDVNTAYLH